MSERYDRLMELLDRALPLPESIDIECSCTSRGQARQLADLDVAGDNSTTGKWPYLCRGCDGRYNLGGQKSPVQG